MINPSVKRIPRPEGMLTEDFYYSTPTKQFTCVEHIKMLEIGFNCMDKQSMSPEDIGSDTLDEIKGILYQSFYVVSKNGRRYFMKVLESLYDLEHELEDQFHGERFSLPLIEYKIVRGRFVGIYSYYKHRHTLYYAVKSNLLTFVQKLIIMSSIANICSDIYAHVEPQNNLIKVNFLASNLLLTQEGYMSFRMINIVRNTKEEKDVVVLPEYSNPAFVVNQRQSAVYIMSRIFYFILSNENFENEIEFMDLNYIKNFHEVHKDEEKWSQETTFTNDLIDLLRTMSNTNPVDRPSIEYVLNIVDHMAKSALSFTEWLEKRSSELKINMKFEVDNEVAENEDRLRIMARQTAARKREKMDDKWKETEKKYKQEIDLNEENQQKFYKYVGRSKECELEDSKELQNPLDTFGFVPNLLFLDADKVIKHSNDCEHGDKHGDEHGDEHHEDLTELKIEFVLLIAGLLLLAMLVSSYFIFKNLDMAGFDKAKFPVHIEIED